MTTYRRNANAIQARSTVAPNITDALYTRAWKTDGVYTVGSISRSSNNNEGAYFIPSLQFGKILTVKQ